jgi:hypothetical protein
MSGVQAYMLAAMHSTVVAVHKQLLRLWQGIAAVVQMESCIR